MVEFVVKNQASLMFTSFNLVEKWSFYKIWKCCCCYCQTRARKKMKFNFWKLVYFIFNDCCFINGCNSHPSGSVLALKPYLCLVPGLIQAWDIFSFPCLFLTDPVQTSLTRISRASCHHHQMFIKPDPMPKDSHDHDAPSWSQSQGIQRWHLGSLFSA